MKGREYLGHATVDDKVSAVDEAALVAGEEEHGLGLLDGFAEAAGGEVYLATVALGRVISEPILKKRRAGKIQYRVRAWELWEKWCGSGIKGHGLWVAAVELERTLVAPGTMR